VGPGSLFWVLVNEIFDDDVKEAGSSMSNILQWGFNLVISSLYPFMSDSVLGKAGTFFVFGGIGIICTVVLAIALRDLNSFSRS